MEIYHELLRHIYFTGTDKPPAREGMPGTRSIFGHQIRHDLSQGFPLLTTKPMYWKGIVNELLWFLRGDTNIKYLVENGVHIWDKDAYNYYKKIAEKNFDELPVMSFNEFILTIKIEGKLENWFGSSYTLGDCGYQYGKVWRKWDTWESEELGSDPIDQISNLISGLRKNPEGRRHILTAIDPAHDQDLALYWCHCLVQFNCRPLTLNERAKILDERGYKLYGQRHDASFIHSVFDKEKIPRYYLDCSYYQRSADVVLGVPFNLASYALLTHILSKMCNMVPGEVINSFGDVHIYENHKEAVQEQIKRSPKPLPELILSDNIHWHLDSIDDIISNIDSYNFDYVFKLEGYDPHPKLKNPTELSTGLKK